MPVIVATPLGKGIEEEVIAQKLLLPEKRGVRPCERNSTEDTKASAEGEAEGAEGAKAGIPLQPMVQPMVRQPCPCNPWRSMGEQRSIEQGVGDKRALVE